MSVRLWTTLTRRKEALEPIDPPRLRLFVCGPTVSPETSEDDARVTADVERRTRLRRERRFAEADEIRQRLGEQRIVVEDTGALSRWYREAPA